MESNTILLNLSDPLLIEALAECAPGHSKSVTITIEVTEKDEQLVNKPYKEEDGPCCGHFGDVDTDKPTKKILNLRGNVTSIDYVEDEDESEDYSEDVEEDEPAVGKYSGKMAKAIGKKSY